jgi:hypothetical protein
MASNVVTPDIANLCSALTLVILLACIFGWVNLSCKVKSGMEVPRSSPTGLWGKDGGTATSLNAVRSDASGSDSGGASTGNTKINRYENALASEGFLLKGNQQGFRNGFATNGYEPPVFWNGGNYDDVDAINQSTGRDMRASAGKPSILAQGQYGLEGMDARNPLLPY